jgi:putative component of membrane protein insertase Oxa1/YidC/SpoIIIJ protein YidD
VWKQVAVALSGAAVAACASATPVRAAEPPSLAGRCLMMAGAGHAGCRRAAGSASAPIAPTTPAPAPAPAPAPGFGYADFAGAYSLYRLVSATDGHRRCRLQPTCSLFAAQAARQLGLLRGLLMGLARAQMSHSDQGGVLPPSVASDGQFVFFDPVRRWLHGAP